MGRLGSEELTAPGGTTYALGDRVVALAPGAHRKVVTSETGTVVALDIEKGSLSVRMDDGGAVRVLAGEEIASDRLAHGYAVTVHRSQGATVERAHTLDDGGGRELAYVKMSRATDRSIVYVVADSVEQAAEDLAREWKAERRLTWVIDRSPDTSRKANVEIDVGAALRRGRLLAERHAILAAVPADPTAAIRATERELDGLRRRRADLEIGRGTYANHPVNRATLDHERAEENVTRLQGNLAGRLGRRERREKETELAQWRLRLDAAAKALDDIRRPEVSRLDKAEAELTGDLAELNGQRDARADWFARRPQAARRLAVIDREVQSLNVIETAPVRGAEVPRGPMRDRPWLRDVPVADHSLDIGLGL